MKSKRKTRPVRPLAPKLSAAVPAAAQVDLLGALDLLRQRRAPYGGLIAAIVAETLRRFSPVANLPILEIGAGAGQLRDWLPADARLRTIHTDPSAAALRRLTAAAPQAVGAAARAQGLPFADAACGAVLALCVFDAIAPAAQAQVVAEAARVLRPRGRFIHFLDMATLLEVPFEKLAASRLVPIPNVFGDPADHDWPLDILLIKGDWLAGLLDFAVRTRHPLADGFGRYFAAFLSSKRRFDAKTATDLFKMIASSGERREALAQWLASACQALVRQGYPPIEPLPFHSGRYLASVIETAFGESGLFRIELSEIISKSERQPRRDGSAVRYQSLCVGHQRIMDTVPKRLLDPAAPARPPAQDGESGGTVAGDLLVEAGVFVFVATRV